MNSIYGHGAELDDGNKKAAAKLLHLNRTTLVEKIKKKGLETEANQNEEDDPLFEA